MTISLRQPIRRAVQAFALASLLGVAALTAVGSAAAAESCGKKVVDDWYTDGRVDGSYPSHCYDDAIELLPRDVLDYSSAKDDISRALQNHLRGLPAPPATTDPTPGAEGPSTETTRSTTAGGASKGDPPKRRKPPKSGSPVAAPPLDTASADSVPIPLLVLGGLALLLVAAGSAGYLARRLQARRVTPPGA